MASPYNINSILARSPEGLCFGKVAQWVEYGDFTDGGAAVGTLTMKQTIPAGSFVIGTKVTVTEAFTGDTSAVMLVGKSSGEDEFSDGTSINIYTVGIKGDEAENVLEFIAAAQSVYLHVTSATDFTLVTAGRMLVEVFYLTTDKSFNRGYPLQSNRNG